MKAILSEIFRLLFRIPFFRKRFFGIHKRFFFPFHVFKGVKKQIKFRNTIILELHIDDWIQENVFFLGEYEEPELRFLEKSLKKGDVFIDIGANIGLYTLHASKLIGPGGRVISFEPFVKNFNSLKKNVSLNCSDNITLENMAVFKTNTQLDILYNNNDSNFGMASSYLNEYSCCEKVDAISLDLYISNRHVERIDFVKIDIEGGEYPALLGMKETLTRYSPKLLIEINNDILSFTPYSEKEIIDFLDTLGYKKYCLSADGELLQTDKDNKQGNFVFIKE